MTNNHLHRPAVPEARNMKRWPYCSGCDPQLHEPYVGRIGEIWEDEDPRHMGRVGRVIRCNETHAWLRWNTGKTTRVRLDRLAPPRYREYDARTREGE